MPGITPGGDQQPVKESAATAALQTPTTPARALQGAPSASPWKLALDKANQGILTPLIAQINNEYRAQLKYNCEEVQHGTAADAAEDPKISQERLQQLQRDRDTFIQASLAREIQHAGLAKAELNDDEQAKKQRLVAQRTPVFQKDFTDRLYGKRMALGLITVLDAVLNLQTVRQFNQRQGCSVAYDETLPRIRITALGRDAFPTPTKAVSALAGLYVQFFNRENRCTGAAVFDLGQIAGMHVMSAGTNKPTNVIPEPFLKRVADHFAGRDGEEASFRIDQSMRRVNTCDRTETTTAAVEAVSGAAHASAMQQTAPFTPYSTILTQGLNVAVTAVDHTQPLLITFGATPGFLSQPNDQGNSRAVLIVPDRSSDEGNTSLCFLESNQAIAGTYWGMLQNQLVQYEATENQQATKDICARLQRLATIYGAVSHQAVMPQAEAAGTEIEGKASTHSAPQDKPNLRGVGFEQVLAMAAERRSAASSGNRADGDETQRHSFRR